MSELKQEMEVFIFDHSQTFPTWLAIFSKTNLITCVVPLEYTNETPKTQKLTKALIIYERKNRI